jgi:hypothetical protein
MSLLRVLLQITRANLDEGCEGISCTKMKKKKNEEIDGETVNENICTNKKR